jgi:poly(hydroxyalkanoate) depolymerase family esterase
MMGLGETTAMLKRMRGQQAGAASHPTTMVEHAGFGSNPGQLRLWLHEPVGLAANAPLVVVLHGCTQGAEAFAIQSGWIALADRLGFAVLAPEQTAANNPNRCFNWFSPSDIQRGQGEAASIAQMIAFVGRTRGHGRGQTFITGLSAGGAMTAVMLATYPELFVGGAVIAGLPYGVAHGIPDAIRVMSQSDRREGDDLADLIRRAGPASAAPPKLSIWHGEADRVVNASNGADLARQWAVAAGLPEASGSTTTTGRRTRQVWRDAAGDARIELNLIQGLGHGVPLATRGQGAVGAAAPFMLEAGLSSTHEIARFWGLESSAQAQSPEPEVASAPPPPPPRDAVSDGPRRPDQGIAAQVLGGLKAKIPAEVEAVIAKAFRAAGLMS